MRGHEGASERGRTHRVAAGAKPRTPAAGTDLALFQAHYAALSGFTDALREGRCKRTNHFDARVRETVAVFEPLFAPWNMEVLFLLYMRGELRFHALKDLLQPVSSRVLTDKLRHLERSGLVTRAAESKAVRYALTPRGAVVARHLHPMVFYLQNEAQLRV